MPTPETRSETAPLLGPDSEQQPQQPQQPQQQPQKDDDAWSVSKKARRLYVSHLLSTGNSRVFEFGSVLYLAAIFPDTLLPLSTYAVVRGLAAMALSSVVGHHIDTGDRLAVVRASIVLQRTAVAASCALFLVLVCGWAEGQARSWAFGGLVGLACVEKLASVMNLVSVERDWVVTIAEDHPEALPAMNATMRRIDLVCKLMGPFAIGILDGVSTTLAISINLGLNLASIPIEYIFISQIYHRVPRLQSRSRATASEAREDGQVPSSPDEHSPSGTWTWIKTSASRLVADNRLYFSHAAFLPSFSCVMLYFTVLSFSGRMVTYLMAQGYTSTQVSVARTVSVGVEVAATWVAPWLMRRIGPVRAGLWFLSWQVGTLAVGTSMFWGEGTQPWLSSLGLVAGVVLSRLGLWGYDLSSQLLVQEAVGESERGAFSTTESAWQSGMELASHASTLVFSDPRQFDLPVALSVAAVVGAWLLYSRYVVRQRGHLLHTEKLMCMQPRREREDRF